MTITIETALKEWLTNGIKDFWDSEYETYRPKNPEEEDLTDRLKDLLEKLNIDDLEYNIVSEKISITNISFIHIIAVSAILWDEGEIDTIIFTARS